MVQCIPVLRPFIKDLHTSLNSRKIAATEPSKGSTWRGSTLIDKKVATASAGLLSGDEEMGLNKPGAFELAEIPEEGRLPRYGSARPGGDKRLGHSAEAYYSPSEVELRIKESHTQPLNNGRAPRGENWPL